MHTTQAVSYTVEPSTTLKLDTIGELLYKEVSLIVGVLTESLSNTFQDLG